MSNFVDDEDELPASDKRHDINSHKVHVCSNVAVECKINELTGVILAMLYKTYIYPCMYVYVC